ncbi:MAG: lipoprotein signal peptidase [Bacteroidia bacterium]|nr:lipoprotein signal peptidase [Bacteroidia bacterium]
MAILTILLVLLIDQYLKYWVIHHMELHTEKVIAGNWFLFHFTLNNGMAFGLEFGGIAGKIFLSVFRIIAVFFGFWYLKSSIKKYSKAGFVICVALILSGAIGNIIDSMFYGIWYRSYNYYEGGFLMGQVIDMLYFPIVEGHYPTWFPFKGGDPFIFFSPVFNFADAAISTGVIAIFVFQKKFFSKKKEPILQVADPADSEDISIKSDSEIFPEDSSSPIEL